MPGKITNVYSDTTAEVNIIEEGHKLRLENATDAVSVDTASIYRPIQYLGTKHRALPVILSKALETVRPGTFVLDIFSGTSVVSQVFNLYGLQVVSNDALQFNAAFSNALLNIQRQPGDLEALHHALESLEIYELEERFVAPFEASMQQEELLLREKQTEQLLALYTQLPQIDKVLFLEENFDPQTAAILQLLGTSAIGSYPLIANYYAGSYFSIFQALELDRLRNGIEELRIKKEITHWQYHFLLTCLLNVSSKIVYTAGKHFAQPIKQENTLKTTVLHKRFYDDRSKNVWAEFQKTASSLAIIAEKNTLSEVNVAMSESLEEIILQADALPPTSVIYADPPYTAQQYSRYYHIPEVLYTYHYPQLQVVNGQATSGLYPENKFRSRFCSKREAKQAFIDLFRLAAKLESSLIISYSASLSEETGNQRMIGLKEIMELGHRYLPKSEAEILKFNFRYRQLNTRQNIVQTKDDKEFLIVFKHPKN